MDCVEAAQRVQDFLKRQNAWWQWDGHKHLALFASGKLGDCYFNCTPLFYAHMLKITIVKAFYAMLKDEMSKSGDNGGKHWGYFTYLHSRNAWVIGSAYGSIWIAESFASILGVKSAFAEKVYSECYGIGKIVPKIQLKRFDLGPDPYVILVEDVTTTGETTRKTKKAIKEKHPDTTFCQAVFTIINRSGLSDMIFYQDGVGVMWPIKALIEVDARTWESEADLPPEMKGCKGIRPKGNWKALTTEML